MSNNRNINNIIAKYYGIILYYLLLVFGASIASLILYNRFIRERLPKDIPFELTEYSFWLLCYICFIYLYIVKSLIKKNKQSDIIKQFMDTLYKPLTTLDHVIKYNRYTQNYYFYIINKLIELVSDVTATQKKILIFLMQILPRTILVSILTFDVFYFKEINLLYTFILLGLIPFVHRYIKYSLKDINDYYIKQLEKKYDKVMMWDLAYNDPDIDWMPTEDNKYHNKNISVRDYVDFIVDNTVYKNTSATYDANVLAKEDTYDNYRKTHNISENIALSEDDYKIIHEEYDTIMPKILQCGIFLELYAIETHSKIITRCKIVIFSLYFLCWFYILCKSYYINPNSFEHTVIFLLNTILHNKDPFSDITIFYYVSEYETYI